MNKIVIKNAIPGKNTKVFVNMDKKYIATGTKTSPVAAKTGRGMWVEDVDGNTILDFTNGMVGITGHCHPKVVNAMKDQLDNFIYFNGPDFYYGIQSKLAKRLTEITPGRFPKKVFFSNSGAEAVEAAWKITRWSTGKKMAIAFIGAFHGRTMGALSLTGSKAVHKNKFFPTVPGVTHIPYAYCYRCAYKMKYPQCDVWCARIIEQVYFKSILPPDEVGALFLEPIQGEGGYVVPPKQWVQEISRICKKYNILLVDDEVQAGFGRTGKMFAIENYNVVPDIITMAKAMGSGVPIGATVFNAKYDFKVEGAHSNTYGGNPISCASALATIDVLKNEKLIQNAKKMGDYFKKGLNNLQRKYPVIGDVRGTGLMLAVELIKDKNKENAAKLRNFIIDYSYKHGLLMLPCGISGIRFTPALVVKKYEIDIALQVLNDAIKRGLGK